MKQVAQSLGDGRVEVLEVPPPALTPDTVLVRLGASLLSAGTERSKVETGRKSLIGKARSRPDQVRQVVEKARRDGIGETVQAVRSRLEAPSPLGYSAAGTVLEVGSRVPDLAPGDRVACGGGDHAVHAEVDRVPGNLCVPLPAGVDFGTGAFATVGSIALHGVRQADARIGERVALIGLGLVGQLAGQLLRAAGCFVVGIDLDPSLVERSRELGSADAAFPRAALDAGSLPPDAAGCDAVVITAATKSSDPVDLAAQLCRDRGRVVVVGDVGMELPRPPYYGKELELRLSRSYGPGRYDREYEERGLDYPIGYVRWTERRNMAAFLDLVAAGRVDVGGLVTERVPIDQAPDAYERLADAETSPLGILLEYPGAPGEAPRARPRAAPASATGTRAGVIGAGSFAQRILIPGLKGASFSLVSVASASGLSAKAASERFDFERADTPEGVLADPDVNLVAIATRHSSHATLARGALEAGKAVFVEKPPCLDAGELDELRAAHTAAGRPLVVGFNRRHAGFSEALRGHVRDTADPVELLYRINAGRLPDDHWLNDLDEGGGRLVGEGCHFVDFACWLVGALPERVVCVAGKEPGRPLAASQGFTVALRFGDGSRATIAYEARGSAKLPKERVEAHAGGRSAVLDDFRSLELFDERGRRRRVRDRSGKGHDRQFAHLARLLAGEETPTEPSPLDTMEATLAARRSLESGSAV